MHVFWVLKLLHDIYCLVPARDPLVEKYGPTNGPILPSQGEPVMSQYVTGLTSKSV